MRLGSDADLLLHPIHYRAQFDAVTVPVLLREPRPRPRRRFCCLFNADGLNSAISR